MVLPKISQEPKHKSSIQRKVTNRRKISEIQNADGEKRKVSVRALPDSHPIKKISTASIATIGDIPLRRTTRPYILSHDRQRQSTEVKLEVEETVSGFFGSSLVSTRFRPRSHSMLLFRNPSVNHDNPENYEDWRNVLPHRYHDYLSRTISLPMAFKAVVRYCLRLK
uniref:Uncharacterized protein n=1 Tax=Syphacia muris TaxID=451379 RepID=A0A0N5AIJ3_9BILA